MKSIRIIILALACTIASTVKAQNIIEQADSAYTADNFALAEQLYTQAIDSLGSSAALYYNLGNTYYRLGRPGKAILNYERALRLEPTYENARENLQFVNDKITDRIDNSGSFISNSYYTIVRAAHPDTWATIALVSFFLLITAVILYIFSSDVRLRKVGFFGGFLLLLVTIATNVLAYSGTKLTKSHSSAIVISPSTILSTSPRQPKDRSEEAFLLHEGTKVEILDSVATPGDKSGEKWYDVSVDNNHRAWISSKVIEQI